MTNEGWHGRNGRRAVEAEPAQGTGTASEGCKPGRCTACRAATAHGERPHGRQSRRPGQRRQRGTGWLGWRQTWSPCRFRTNIPPATGTPDRTRPASNTPQTRCAT